jgi:hypothetical protein
LSFFTSCHIGVCWNSQCGKHLLLSGIIVLAE